MSLRVPPLFLAFVGFAASLVAPGRSDAVLAIARGSSATQFEHRPDVVYLATPQNVVDAMLDLARVTSSDVVYDLGSGDGRIPITAAQRYGAQGVGIEIDANRIRQANDNLRKAGAGARVTFRQQDLFEADIRDATVVTLFLLPSLNARLMPKLKRELRPGARIVSHHFDMGEAWPPDVSRDVNGLMIYLWTIR
jgi:tRNA A58 N-methylase Trm61